MHTHRIRLSLLHLVVTLLLLVAATASAATEPVRYVATIHPLAAVLREITSGRAEVVSLLQPGNSPHTFEPTPSDLKGLETAQALFFGGQNLDGEWVRKLPVRHKVAMIDLVPEDHRLCIQEEHGHHHGAEAHHSDAEEANVDPHFWTDPLTVKAMVPHLVRQLGELDPAGKARYATNGKKFSQRLERLDRELSSILKPIADEPLLLFHPSFNYLFRRYNLQSAGVVVEAPGREPSPRFLFAMVKRIKAQGIKALFTEPQLPKRPAQVLAESANIPVYELDPIGGVPGRESYPGLLLYNGVTLAKPFSQPSSPPKTR